MNQSHLILFLLSLSVWTKGTAQLSHTSPLYLESKQLDSLLFAEGFNHCNIAVLDSLIATDFEFYHDENGTQNRSEFLRGFNESICSNPHKKPIRNLVHESLEVFPLYREGTLYGIIQQGKHEFYIREDGKPLYKTNIARFSNVWILEEAQWKLSRVLSYDHQHPGRDYGERFEARYDAALFDNDANIEALLKQHHIPSLGIGYIQDGVLRQIRAFGDKRAGHPAEHNTMYKVASLTKPITAIVTLKLVDQGLWNLDDPVYEYHVDEDVKNAPELKQLTTRHILSHTSGFPNWRYLSEDGKLHFEFAPGTWFQYSGEGFEYLRNALEAKFGKGLDELAQELLFTPLQMNNTHFYWNARTPEEKYAVEHDKEGNEIDFVKHMQPSAAANLMTTVQNYGNFMAYVVTGAGLSDSLYQEFITPHSTKKEGIDWGLGCELLLNLNEQGEFAIMHGGGDYGLKTLMLLLPQSKKGLLIFTNSENGMVVWRKIVEEYFGAIGQEIVRRQLQEP